MEFDERHCSRWGGIDQDAIPLFGRLVCEILTRSFRTGIYDLPIKWENVNWNYGRGVRCILSHRPVATFDFDYLTRLVIIAHDECVRVEIEAVAPHRLALDFHQRKTRKGSIMLRHPTIEQAIASVRGADVSEKAA